jgi:hypothetical protein
MLSLRERPPTRCILHVSVIFDTSIPLKRDVKVICGSSIISSIKLSLAASVFKFYKIHIVSKILLCQRCHLILII